MSESTPYNPEESTDPSDLAKDIVNMQEGPEAAQNEDHVAEVSENIERLRQAYEEKNQQGGR